MKRILNVTFVTLFIVALAALNSCILDPDKSPPKEDDNNGGGQVFESLEKRDDVLNNLELSYNTRNINEYSRILDDDFTFFFSTADAGVPESWDRAAELGATANMFDPSFSPPNRDPISSIDLTISFPAGEDNWIVIPGTPENGHDGEDWYEKVVQYLLTVKAGETTFTSGTQIDASFVVRPVQEGGKQIFRIVQWRDDI